MALINWDLLDKHSHTKFGDRLQISSSNDKNSLLKAAANNNSFVWQSPQLNTLFSVVRPEDGLFSSHIDKPTDKSSQLGCMFNAH